MNWTQLLLDRSEPRLEFGDGVSLKVAGRQRRTPAGQHLADLVAYGNDKAIELRDAIDDGQTTDNPRCFVIQGQPAAQLIVLGGPVAYKVTSSCESEKAVTLWREWADSEYWVTQIVGTGFGLVVIYEAGVLLIGSDLAVRWHYKKYFDDVFDSIDGDRLQFRKDNDQQWQLSLRDGERA